ncbi:HU family DNA-binding protein [Streptomyces sp. NPDC001595]|uniref:HU family DNA-binding protein n=1 Tax=Streptomyces sp. NPDC001532 TaxID=3154520 RepID=UPI00332B2421
MDKAQLLENTAHRAAQATGGDRIGTEDVERVLDALFGTVEHPGTIAEALKSRESVTLGSFGSFRADDGTAAFRPGKALTEYLHGEVG